jgi:hypothetical protein
MNSRASGEAEAIRHYVGIAKKRVLSEAKRERLADMGQRFAFRPSAVGCDEKRTESPSAAPPGRYAALSARRPELRARSDPCIVPLTRG